MLTDRSDSHADEKFDLYVLTDNQIDLYEQDYDLSEPFGRSVPSGLHVPYGSYVSLVTQAPSGLHELLEVLTNLHEQEEKTCWIRRPLIKKNSLSRL